MLRHSCELCTHRWCQRPRQQRLPLSHLAISGESGRLPRCDNNNSGGAGMCAPPSRQEQGGAGGVRWWRHSNHCDATSPDSSGRARA